MIFFPISELISNSTLVVYEFGFTGIKGEGEINNVFSVLPYTLLLSLCLFILVATLFLFKKRVVQTRLTIFNIVLLVGLQGLAYYYTTAAGTELDANYSFTILFIFPILAAILSYLALRAIIKDELLIRSLNRLR
jgi:drug/metabolite transporter (DMT)-like permease